MLEGGAHWVAQVSPWRLWSPGEWLGMVTSLAVIAAAELGDKTQLAVAGLSTTLSPVAVWIGATLGLGGVSALGVILGRTLFRRLSIQLLHRISGGLFLALAGVALAGIDWPGLWRRLAPCL